MDKYSRLGKNTIIVFIGNIGVKLISFIMLPFYTRWLSVENYGITDIINVYVNLLLGLTTVCIVDAIFIFPKDKPIEEQKGYFSSGLIIVSLTLLFTVFLFKILLLIYKHIGIENSFTDNVWFIYGILVTNFLQQYIQQFVRSIDKLWVYTKTGIIMALAIVLFSFLFVEKWGIKGYVIVLILSNLTASFYSFFASKSYTYISFIAVKKIFIIELLKYSIPLIPNTIMFWVVGALNRFVLGNYIDMYALGIFAVANKFPNILSVFITIFSTAWSISVLEEFGKEGYECFFNKILKLLIACMFLLFLILAIGSKLIVMIFTTDDFYESWRYIPLLTFGSIFLSISGFMGSNFAATRESKYFFYSSILGAITSIIINIILVPILGIMGAAISSLLSFMTIAITRMVYCLKYIKIVNIKYYIQLFVLGLLLSLILEIEFQIFFKELLIISICFIFLYMSRGLKDDVLSFIKNIKTNNKNQSTL
jgi:O-antigen/teichoic acid export membrane protein